MARSVARRGSGYVTAMNGIVATARIDIEAPASRVWTALTEPDQIAAYMFGSRVETDWDDISMGLGWQLEKHEQDWLPRHPGGDPGFHTLLTLDPPHQRAIVILSNGETTPRWEIRDLIEKFLDSKAN